MKKVYALLVLVSVVLGIFSHLVNEKIFFNPSCQERHLNIASHESPMRTLETQNSLPSEKRHNLTGQSTGDQKFPQSISNQAIEGPTSRLPQMSQPHKKSSKSEPQTYSKRFSQAYEEQIIQPPLLTMEVEFPIPSGSILPAALVDSTPDSTYQQAAILDTISEGFLEAIQLGTEQNQSEALSVENEVVWKEALLDADEQYRAVFGQDAYIAWTNRAAQEALAEKP